MYVYGIGSFVRYVKLWEEEGCVAVITETESPRVVQPLGRLSAAPRRAGGRRGGARRRVRWCTSAQRVPCKLGCRISCKDFLSNTIRRYRCIFLFTNLCEVNFGSAYVGRPRAADPARTSASQPIWGEPGLLVKQNRSCSSNVPNRCLFKSKVPFR